MTGGARDRVEFSNPALDLVFAGSDGIPRLVNRICDRALFYGYLDRTAQIGQSQVGRALHELELAPLRQDMPSSTHGSAVPPTVTTSGGLFVKTAIADTPSSGVDLSVLLELPTVSRQTREPLASSRNERSAAPSRRATPRSVWWRRAFKSLSVPALGMGVMMLAGGIAVSTAGNGSISAALPALPVSPLVFPTPLPRWNRLSSAGRATKPVAASASPTVSLAGTSAGASEQTWVVQIAAFTSLARSVSMVQHLTNQGWPAYQVEPDASTRGLTLVRVGPFRTAAEADEVRAKLLATPDYEGAFVRNITTR